MRIFVDEKFGYLIRRYRIDLQYDRPIKSLTCLTLMYGDPILSVQEGLEGPELVEAIAIQIGHLVMGSAGRRYRLLPESLQRLCIRKDWCRAEKWAAGVMVPDDVLARAEREEWEPWQIAEECQITERLVGIRLDEWLTNHLAREGEPKILDRPPSFFRGRSPKLLAEES